MCSANSTCAPTAQLAHAATPMAISVAFHTARAASDPASGMNPCVMPPSSAPVPSATNRTTNQRPKALPADPRQTSQPANRAHSMARPKSVRATSGSIRVKALLQNRRCTVPNSAKTRINLLVLGKPRVHQRSRPPISCSRLRNCLHQPFAPFRRGFIHNFYCLSHVLDRTIASARFAFQRIAITNNSLCDLQPPEHLGGTLDLCSNTKRSILFGASFEGSSQRARPHRGACPPPLHPRVGYRRRGCRSWAGNGVVPRICPEKALSRISFSAAAAS